MTTRIKRGQIAALFAFDIGYEVVLDEIETLFSATPVQPISRKRQTPTHMQYKRPPVVLNLASNEKLRGEACVAQATIFDFGAVSISYRWSVGDSAGLQLQLEDLPLLSNELYKRDLEVKARAEVLELVERIKTAVVRTELSDLVEDYYLFVIEELDPSLPATELLTRHPAPLAQTISFEVATLSHEQQLEVLSEKMSYSENDLTVIDWNAALIVDPDFEDAARVLELLNVELLEARYIDAVLDRRIVEYAGLLQKRAEWPIPLRTPYKRPARQLTELRLEYTLLAERVGNSLKLIGDLYLSRLHSGGARKLHLHEWERIIAHKLQIIDDLYERLNDRIRTAQSQTLELAIVTLIVVELLLALFK